MIIESKGRSRKEKKKYVEINFLSIILKLINFALIFHIFLSIFVYPVNESYNNV